MNLVINLRTPDACWSDRLELLSKYANVSVVYNFCENTRNWQNAEVLITTYLDVNTLNQMSNLKAVFVSKTGIDTFPIDELKRKNVLLVNSHANSQIIAEHAIALSFALLHRVCEYHNELREGTWYGNGTDCKWHSLASLNVGIIGYGHIGKNIDRLIKIFCKNVFTLNRGKEKEPGTIIVNTLEELINSSDLLFLALPKNQETVNLINGNNIELLRGKYLINVGRAASCNEQALYHSLKNNILLGYASDVWYCEPDKTNKMHKTYPSNFPFHKLPNVVLSPHCATHEETAHEKYITDTISNCIAYLKSQSSGT